MKTRNLIVAAVAVATLNVTTSVQAGEPLRSSGSRNVALLNSPRFLEEHPELLRAAPSAKGTRAMDHRKAERLAKLTANSALASSPRFREEHPELRWATPAVMEFITRAVDESDRLANLKANRAVAKSPRFLEEHPELSRGTVEFEIAPVK